MALGALRALFRFIDHGRRLHHLRFITAGASIVSVSPLLLLYSLPHRLLTPLLLLYSLPSYSFILSRILSRRDKNTKDDHIAFYSAGAFVLLTIPISVSTIILHLKNYYMPQVQKFVVRILWMVPLYSVQSWMSLRFHESSLYIETLRDMYEAYVLAR